MDLKLHANATTTPRTRAYIQHSSAPIGARARELGNRSCRQAATVIVVTHAAADPSLEARC